MDGAVPDQAGASDPNRPGSRSRREPGGPTRRGLTHSGSIPVRVMATCPPEVTSSTESGRNPRRRSLRIRGGLRRHGQLPHKSCRRGNAGELWQPGRRLIAIGPTPDLPRASAHKRRRSPASARLTQDRVPAAFRQMSSKTTGQERQGRSGRVRRRRLSHVQAGPFVKTARGGPVLGIFGRNPGFPRRSPITPGSAPGQPKPAETQTADRKFSDPGSTFRRQSFGFHTRRART